MNDPVDTIDRYPNVSVEALRLVLAALDFDRDAFDTTLDEVCHTCVLRDIANLAATWLTAAVTAPRDDFAAATAAATRLVCDQLAAKLEPGR